MSKITLNDVGTLIDATTAQTAINNNFDIIEAAMDNTVSRDGTIPNTIESSIDMNGNQIINLPAPLTDNSPLRLSDLDSFVGGGTITNIPSGGTTGQVLAKASNANFNVQWNNSGTVNSVGLALPADFSVTGSPVTTSGTLTGAWASTPTGTSSIVRSNTPTLTTPVLNTPTISTPVINGASTGTGVSLGAAPTTLMMRDGNANISYNNDLFGYTQTTPAGGTQVLTAASTKYQVYSGSSSNHTVTLPLVNTLTLGHSFIFYNDSGGIVTINSSGGNLINTIPASGRLDVICVLQIGTTNTSWSFKASFLTIAGGKRPTFANTLNLQGTDGTTITFPTTSATIARVDAANTFTGHQTIEGVTATGATGTGNMVYGTSPTLVTPVLGAASATTLALTAAPTAAIGVDFTGSTITVAGSSSTVIADFTGLVVLTDITTSGQTGVYILGGSSTGSYVLVAGGTAFVTPTITPAANKYSIGFDGTHNRIYNGNASSVNFNVAGLRTRSTT